MKILQVTTNYPTVSNPILGIFMKEQVESVERFGVENTIFFSNGSETHVGRKGGGAMVHIRSVFRLMKHLCRNRYDLIHCHSALSGMILLLSGGAFFNRCVISFQNDPEKKGDRAFFRILYPFFNKVIVKKRTKYDSWKKMIYLPNGCNMEVFRPMDKEACKRSIGLDPAKRYVLFVDSNTSRKRTQKRRDRFDGTMKLLREKYGHDDIETLVMIGIARKDVTAYMNACDLHILSSDQEGSPNSVKECLCCGVPVVATDVGNVHDLLDDVPGCGVADSFTSEELAELANKALRNVPAASELSGSIVRKELDMDSVAEKLYRIYNEIVG